MEFKIFQLKNTRKTEYGFMWWKFAKEHGFKMDDYEEVYSGEREYRRNFLDILFEEFNINRPEDFHGHSLSTSDIISVKKDNTWHYYYCDSFDWEDITENVKKEFDRNMLLWNILKDHFGHKVEIAVYGDPDDPASVVLEDVDTDEVILDAEIYTICARED